MSYHVIVSPTTSRWRGRRNLLWSTTVKPKNTRDSSNNLVQQAQTMAGSAEHWQFTGNVVQAQQLMMTAQMMFGQAKTMQGKAKALHIA